MFRLAKFVTVGIAIAGVTLFFASNLILDSLLAESPEAPNAKPPDWGIQTYSPPRWDADICAKQRSKGETCVIGRPENVAMMCTAPSAATTWPHVQVQLVIPAKQKILADLEGRRIRRLAKATPKAKAPSKPSSSGGSSSSSSSGAGLGSGSGSSSSSSSSGASIPERFGTFFDMIVDSDLRSFGKKQDTYHFLHALFLDNMRYGYASGDWSSEALTRRGFKGGDEITVSIPLTPWTRTLLENLRSGKKTSGRFSDRMSPMLIKLDKAQKIRDEIIGCSDYDKSVGTLDFDETNFSGAWARSQSPVVEQTLKPIACAAGRSEVYVADKAGQAFVWHLPRKRLGPFPNYGSITHRKVRLEPPYVFIKSLNADTKLVAVKVSQNMIVLKEAIDSGGYEPNSLIFLQRCEPSFDASIFDSMKNRTR